MRKILLLVGWLIGLQGETAAQVYSFSRSMAAYTPLASPLLLSDPGWNNGASAINIGFPFTLGHQTYTSVQVNTDGYLDFVEAGTESWIDGFYADLNDRNLPEQPSTIGYQLEGSPGSQILKIEWQNAGFAEGGATEFIHFQVWLYEGSNKISLHFGPSHVISQATIFGHGSGPDVGLVSVFNSTSLTVDGLYLQGYETSPGAVTLVNATAYPNLESVPRSGTVYTFTRTAPALPLVPAALHLTFYPNPARDLLQVKGLSSNKEAATVTVTDALGKVVLRQKVTSAPTVSIDLKGLQKGAYYVELTSGGSRTGKRIIKL